MHPVPPAAACASTVALPRTNRPKPTAAPRRLCRPVSKRRWLTPVLLGLVLSSAALGSARAAPSVKPYTIVAFGDSTTAPRGTLVVYPNLLQNELIVRDRPVRVINAGIGGNTTHAALARLAAEVLAHRPDLVVVQFGINDSAVDVWKNPPAVEPRVPLEQFEANLRGIVQTLRARSAKVILMTPNPLCGAPPKSGPLVMLVCGPKRSPVRLPRFDGHELSPKKGLNHDEEEGSRGNAPAV